MKSKVYFVRADNADDIDAVNTALKRLLDASRVLDCVDGRKNVAVKVHFGEEGNTGYVRPEHLGLICDAISAKACVPVASDANTLYRGRRLNSADHRALAHEHGFTRQVIGADIVIPDDANKEEKAEVAIDQARIKSAKVAKFYLDADAIVAVSHFKGHILTGFGGAVKTMGMGCATREGKLAQHCDAAPVFYAENCTGCGECGLVCPAGAVHVENGKTVLDKGTCIGCASCVAACPTMALFVDFEAGEALQEKMAEYALAVLREKKDRSCFINFALRINQECDCWGKENPRMAPDVGILASLDPVAVDRASYDVVNRACGRDIFREVHPKQDGLRQLRHAEKIGLGAMEYELVEI